MGIFRFGLFTKWAFPGARTDLIRHAEISTYDKNTFGQNHLHKALLQMRLIFHQDTEELQKIHSQSISKAFHTVKSYGL